MKKNLRRQKKILLLDYFQMAIPKLMKTSSSTDENDPKTTKVINYYMNNKKVIMPYFMFKNII